MAFHAACACAQSAAFERDPFSSSAKSEAAPTARPEAWGRDPFNSPFSTGEQTGQGPPRAAHENVLTGIIYSKNVRIAIIGGEALRVGDLAEDRKIIDIRRSSVVLKDRSGHREELFLENYSVPK